MAQLIAYQPLDMTDDSRVFGRLDRADATGIEVGGDNWANLFSGTFSYEFGGVFGTVDGLSQTVDGQLAMEVTGFATDAYSVSRALDQGRLDLLNAMVFFGADTFHGSTGDDVLTALGGNDVLRGRGGNDALMGDEGGDRLYGGRGADILVGASGSDRIAGGRGADRLAGGGEDDRLFGGAGDDLLDGQSGRDHLVGGTGADTFHFSPGSGRDVIRDFDPTEGDVLALDTDFAVVGLTAEAILQEYAHVTPNGATKISLGNGDRLILRNVDDLSVLTEAIDLF